MDRRGVVRTDMSGVKLRLAIACVAVLGALAVSAGLAQAHIAHEKIGEFSSVGGTPTGVAIDNTTQDIYVGSNASNAVFKFNPAGEPIDGAGNPTTSPLVTEVFAHLDIAVDNASDPSAHDLYVPDGANHLVKKFKSNGEFICKLNENEPACPGASLAPFSGNEGPEAVAVDPATGYVYVSDKGNNVVDVFSPGGEYVTKIVASNSHPLQSPRDLKVDSSGNVFVATEGTGVPFAVVKFAPSSEPATGTTTWTETVFNETESATAIAIDAANNIYIALASGLITEYNPAGVALSSFSGEGVGFGLAVNNTTGNVYYARLGEGVAIFNTYLSATVATGLASEVKLTSAKVEGTVNPEGLTIAKCFFEYGASQTTPCNLSGAEIGTGNAPVPVTAALAGLEPGTRYPYKLVVEVEGHEDKGAEAEFTTPSLATVTTEAATNVLPESATLNGKVTPLVSGEVEYYIEYGKEEPYAKTPVHKQPAVEGEAIKVEEAVSGLAPAVEPTAYHYRLVAIIEGHTLNGELLTFETPAVTTVATEAATSVASETATLNAQVNVLAGTANYYFEYGQEPPYIKTEEKPLTLGEHKVAASITGLAPGKPYFFRVVAIPSAPNTLIFGGLSGFTTKFGLPVVSGETASHEERHSARLEGAVNPKNGETTYYFEYVTAQEYATAKTYEETGGPYGRKSTPPGTISAEAAGTSPVAVGPVLLSELDPGTEYHYRLVAIGPGGTTYGTDGTFKTKNPLLPSAIPPPNEAKEVEVTSPTSATLNFQFTLNGLAATYTLEMGSEVDAAGRPIYSTPTFGAVPEDGALSFSLTNLLPSSVYHVRVVLRNADGSFTGEDHTFVTPGFPAVILTPPPIQIVPTPPIPPEPRPGCTSLSCQYHHAVALCKKKPKKKRAACVRRAKERFGLVRKKGKK
jgi:DNA-binding beta-propeller fold protein YncE